VAAACGAGAFLLVVGSVPLDFMNVAWMHGGDLSQYYLGWSFFRRSAWQSTPSLNPDFGLEIATTIFFSDIIPLAALPAKYFAPPDGPWQYHGWWLLICFVFQAVFASKISGLFIGDPWRRFLISVLACFAPVFLLRVNLHLALAGQWLILAALFLCLRQPLRSQPFYWAAICSIAAMVHSYIAVMVVALWGADVARRTILGGSIWRRAPEIVLVPMISAGALLLAGFRLLDGGGLAQGRFFGQFQTDLIGLVDLRGWSWASSLSRPAGETEGVSFIGTGGLVLIGLAIAALGRQALRPSLPVGYVPLASLLLALFLFSLSHRIVAAGQLLIVLPVPGFILNIAELFRASERFFWPLYYFLLLGAAITVARRLPGRRGVLVLALAVVIQVADTSAGWLRVRETSSRQGADWPTALQDPFWHQAGNEYRTLRRILAQSHAPGWSDLAHFALVHGMPTDIVYLARFSFARLGALRFDGQSRVAAGRFDSETLYILDDDMAQLALATVNTEHDLLARIDGHNVLAPGWVARHGIAPGITRLTLHDLLPVYRPDGAIEFAVGQPGTAAVFFEGSDTPEARDAWSAARPPR
jgi:hypothetical protein